MKRGKRAASLLLALALVLSYAAVPVFAAGETGDTEKESIPQGNQTEGSWVYEVAEGAMGSLGVGKWPEIPEEPEEESIVESMAQETSVPETTPTPEPTLEITPEPEETSGGLSGGAIAVIVIAVIAVIAVVAVVLKKRASKNEK